MDDQNDSVPSPQVLLFSLLSSRLTPSTSQSSSSKHSTPSRISHHRNPQDTRIHTHRDLLQAHRHRRHLSSRQTPARAGHLPNGSTAQPIHIPIPFSSSFVHLPLGDAELSAGPPVCLALFKPPFAATTLPQLCSPPSHGLSSSACSVCTKTSVFEG